VLSSPTRSIRSLITVRLLESYYRCLQNIRGGNSLPSTGRALDRRIIHLPRATGCTLAVPYGMFSLPLPPEKYLILYSFHQMSFLPPPSLRHVIAVPRQDKVDFRAACFCHKNIVDIGFVCSVCLSSKFTSTSDPVVFNPRVMVQYSVPLCPYARPAGAELLILPSCLAILIPFLISGPNSL